MQRFMDVTKCRVLLVEDELSQRNLFVEVLDDEHIDVVGVLSSKEAIKILKATDRVSLLITDIRLKEKTNGLELAAHARRIHPDIRIMFVTGYLQGIDISKKAANMGDKVMFKPFKLGEFVRQVNKILETLPCHTAWLATTAIKRRA